MITSNGSIRCDICNLFISKDDLKNKRTVSKLILTNNGYKYEHAHKKCIIERDLQDYIKLCSNCSNNFMTLYDDQHICNHCLLKT